MTKIQTENGISLDFKGFLGYYYYRETKMMVKTMTKTVHLLRKAQRAGAGESPDRVRQMEDHF